MADRMARPATGMSADRAPMRAGARTVAARAIVGLITALTLLMASPGHTQTAPPPVESTIPTPTVPALPQTAPVIPALPPLPAACETPGTQVITTSPLPNIANALKARKKINIMAIGSTSASLRGPVSGDRFAALERFLEATFKGLDVEIMHRGVSGELAVNAAERIGTEAAMAKADVVLWQLGTADALAQIPVDDFKAAVTQTISWLKTHNIDVILVGMRYTLSMTKDEHYQAIRQSILNIAKEQNVLRVGLYEAEETLEKIRSKQGIVLSEIEATDSDYTCVAESLARSIAVGLFTRPGPILIPAPKAP
jgi:acyl-CoA thioesterase I